MSAPNVLPQIFIENGKLKNWAVQNDDGTTLSGWLMCDLASEPGFVRCHAKVTSRLAYPVFEYYARVNTEMITNNPDAIQPAPQAAGLCAPCPCLSLCVRGLMPRALYLPPSPTAQNSVTSPPPLCSMASRLYIAALWTHPCGANPRGGQPSESPIPKVCLMATVHQRR